MASVRFRVQRLKVGRILFPRGETSTRRSAGHLVRRHDPLLVRGYDHVRKIRTLEPVQPFGSINSVSSVRSRLRAASA